ncbi:MAG: hypothetical protein ACPLRN_03160, partial [Microgenomates group bacterium]
MKIKINSYLRQLIKENYFYFIGFFVLSIFFLLILVLGINKINTLNQNIEKLSSEVNNLNKKYQLINTIIPDEQILDEDMKVLNALIPNSEDYFSIIFALENLSQKTGFIITGYTVNISQSTPNKLRLVVNGVGDTDAFLKFLQNYQFGGGRLITSDKITLSQNLNGAIKLD